MFRLPAFLLIIPAMGLLLGLSVAPASSAFSTDNAPAERWSRSEALHSAASANTEAWSRQLQVELRAGDDPARLNSLRQLARDTSLSAPAREKLLYQYVQTLRQEAPFSASKELLAFLQNYTSTVLVEDEDHPRGLVPLFSISSAAVGVENEWLRQEAAYRGAVHLAAGAQTLVNAYLDAAELPERSGLVSALSNASPEQLDAVAYLAMEHIVTRPEAFMLAAAAALQARNIIGLVQLVSRFENPEMARLLQRSAEVLNPQQAGQLLEAALESGSALTASLGLATLSPVLAGDLHTESMLVEKLADAELGSTAALALARTASPRTLRKLQALAKPENQSVQAARARMALQLREARYVPEDSQ